MYFIERRGWGLIPNFTIRFTTILRRFAYFAKLIPDFSALGKNDQGNLLRAAVLEMCLLRGLRLNLYLEPRYNYIYTLQVHSLISSVFHFLQELLALIQKIIVGRTRQWNPWKIVLSFGYVCECIVARKLQHILYDSVKYCSLSLDYLIESV